MQKIKHKVEKVKQNGLPKFKISSFIFPLIILIAIIVILFNLSELDEIRELFLQAKWYFLVLALCAQILATAFFAASYYYLFKVFKVPDIKFWKVFRFSVTGNFIKFTIPSAGIAGDVWFFKKFRKNGANEGKALLAVLTETFTYYIAFFCLMIVSIIYAYIYLGNIDVYYRYAVLAFGFVVVVIMYLVYRLFKNRDLFHKKLAWITEKIDRLDEKRSHKKRISDMIEDFYCSLGFLKKNKKKLILPILFQCGKFASDALTIWFIFMAFSSYATFMLSLVAFAFGRFLGVLSFMPGGLGAFEGGMVLVLTFLYPLELAISVMLVFRFFSYWLYIPFGILFAKNWKIRKKKKVKKKI